MDGILVTGNPVAMAYMAATELNIDEKGVVANALHAYCWLMGRSGAVVLTDQERKKLLRGEIPY